MRKKIILIILAALALVQFIPVYGDVPVVDPQKDFLVVTKAGPKESKLIKNACYDCHSYATQLPWYSKVAPVSWWTAHHVNEGREHLNFSLWADYPKGKIDHKLEECSEETEEGEMPLNSYTWTHSDAKLSEDDKKLLVDFFNSLRVNSDHAEE